MKNLYDEDYYERGLESKKSCYSNYRWIPELTIPMAFQMIEYLNIKSSDTILDFGCAKGYLVKAFRMLYRQAYGYDISTYAKQSAPEDIKKYIIEDYCKEHFTWVIAKDVFEHIPYDELDDTLSSIAAVTEKVFCIIPLGENGQYIIPAYELDATHIVRENMDWWKECFTRNKFKIQTATYNVAHIKDNWKQWEKGNGFFVLESRH